MLKGCCCRKSIRRFSDVMHLWSFWKGQPTLARQR
uniref:Uncharacterized protein n=1 Tax=Siphoviridae sp. ctzlI32 TaxID=2827981 RepID=A0A8S5SXT1_9CAUD|nr:MAG TPA: hypothetical protein [Siphoviridae sp. ctzlI32]